MIDMDTAETVTKSAFAALLGVSPPCVTGWIRRGKLYGDALVGDAGRRKRIRVDIAREQLKQTLDPSQRLGGNGKVRFDDEPVGDRVSLDSDIRRARLEQLELANEHARAVREAEAGRYVRSDDVRQEMGADRRPHAGSVRGVPRRNGDGGCRQIKSAGARRPAHPADHVPQHPRAHGQDRERHRQGAAGDGRRCGGSSMTSLANPERLAHEAIAAALRPNPPIDYLDFAERHVVFDDPIPGPFDRNKFPYFAEILRALSPSDPCRYVTVISSAQIGKTTIGNIFTLGSLTMGRGTVMYCHPTDDNARRWSRMKLSPMMRATPIVAEQFPQRARDGADNVLFKDRKDGLARLLITGANRPASLSQVTAEFLVEDDLSKWEPNAAGDPETQADNRARAIEFAKILKISTPLVLPGCKITRNFELGSMEMPLRAVPALLRDAGSRMGQYARQSRSGAPGARAASPAAPAVASSRSIIGRKCSLASNGARKIQRRGANIGRSISGRRILICRAGRALPRNG